MAARVSDGQAVDSHAAPEPEALVPLSVPEVRRLLWIVLRPRTPTPWFALAWSVWRRMHQAVARQYHYRRHLALVPP